MCSLPQGLGHPPGSQAVPAAKTSWRGELCPWRDRHEPTACSVWGAMLSGGYSVSAPPEAAGHAHCTQLLTQPYVSRQGPHPPWCAAHTMPTCALACVSLLPPIAPSPPSLAPCPLQLSHTVTVTHPTPYPRAPTALLALRAPSLRCTLRQTPTAVPQWHSRWCSSNARGCGHRRCVFDLWVEGRARRCRRSCWCQQGVGGGWQLLGKRQRVN
jgi:hypothetical protein